MSFIISSKFSLNEYDWKRFALNLLKFTAPILAVFFKMLADGVPLEKAWWVGLLALYGAISDLLSKWASQNTYRKS